MVFMWWGLPEEYFSLWCCQLCFASLWCTVLKRKKQLVKKFLQFLEIALHLIPVLVFQKSWAMPAIWENSKISFACSCCQISHMSGLLESENPKSVKFTCVLCCHSVVIYGITGFTWSECYLLSQYFNLLSNLQRLSNTISTWNPVNLKRLWPRNIWLAAGMTQSIIYKNQEITTHLEISLPLLIRTLVFDKICQINHNFSAKHLLLYLCDWSRISSLACKINNRLYWAFRSVFSNIHVEEILLHCSVLHFWPADNVF